MSAEIQPIVEDAGQVPKPVRLILPGGGVRGAFQVGFLQALHASGRCGVDRAYGTSVGALLAPYAVSGRTDELRQLFESLRSVDDVAQRWHFPFSRQLAALLAVFKLGAFQRLNIVDRVAAAFADDGDEALKRCECVAWDVLNKREVWFSGAGYKQGMRASSALWMAVPPVPYTHPEGPDAPAQRDTLLVDGGATEVIPVSRVLFDGADEGFDGVYVVVLASPLAPVPTTQRPGTALDLLYTLQWDAACQLQQRELDMLRAKLGADRVLVVQPTSDEFSGALDVDPAKMARAFDAGAAAFGACGL